MRNKVHSVLFGTGFMRKNSSLANEIRSNKSSVGGRVFSNIRAGNMTEFKNMLKTQPPLSLRKIWDPNGYSPLLLSVRTDA
jgi:hypothetical protein